MYVCVYMCVEGEWETKRQRQGDSHSFYSISAVSLENRTNTVTLVLKLKIIISLKITRIFLIFKCVLLWNLCLFLFSLANLLFPKATMKFINEDSFFYIGTCPPSCKDFKPFSKMMRPFVPIILNTIFPTAVLLSPSWLLL